MERNIQLIVEHAYISNANDAATYLGSDAALKRLGIADANGIVNYFGLQHATPGTEYKGVNYKIVFDPTYYMDKYPDVKKAVGGDPQMALEHFVNCGIREGRNGRPEFDVIYYKNKYPDLQKAFGNDLYTYYIHYLNSGINEGRQACEHFDVFSYKARYSDLQKAFGNDLKAYVVHYIDCGKAEGRNGGKDTTVYTVQFVQNGNVIDTQYVEFGYSAKEPANALKRNGATLVYDKSYSAVTSDMVVNVQDLYIYNGVDYTKVFDADYYLTKYSDLHRAFGMDGNKALKHFVDCGMKEGRQANESFNFQSYKNRYPDLRKAFGNDKKIYYIHYINSGSKEGRIATGCENQIIGAMTQYKGVDYSNVYDFNYYVSKNPDVFRVYGYDEYRVLEHFVICGMKEGRLAKESFNVQSYKNRYPDLRKAFGNDNKNYYIHYINSGSKEGRVATGYENQIIGAVTQYKGVDYRDVYDFNYYVLKNPDVFRVYGYDEYRVLEHFVICGMKEGRLAKENFNVKTYKNRYIDLRKAFGNDNKAYYIHYIYNGKKEGRSAV